MTVDMSKTQRPKNDEDTDTEIHVDVLESDREILCGGCGLKMQRGMHYINGISPECGGCYARLCFSCVRLASNMEKDFQRVLRSKTTNSRSMKIQFLDEKTGQYFDVKKQINCPHCRKFMMHFQNHDPENQIRRPSDETVVQPAYKSIHIQCDDCGQRFSTHDNGMGLSVQGATRI